MRWYDVDVEAEVLQTHTVRVRAEDRCTAERWVAGRAEEVLAAARPHRVEVLRFRVAGEGRPFPEAFPVPGPGGVQ